MVELRAARPQLEQAVTVYVLRDGLSDTQALHSLRGHTRTDLSDGVLDSSWLWVAQVDPRPLDWNGPATRLFTRFRDQDLDRPIIEHLERVARRHRNRIAIRDASTALTFSGLWDAVSGLAETLAADTEPGDLIAVLLPACPLFPIGVLACLAAGRPFVVLDTHHPADWLGHVLRDARPTLIITLEDGLERVAAPMPTARVIRLTNLPGPARKDWRPATMGVDEPACVLFTSGSTGRPKSVVNSQRNLLQRVAQSINAAHINAADRLLTLASPSDRSSASGRHDRAAGGRASIHLLDHEGVRAREILNVIRAEAITICSRFRLFCDPSSRLRRGVRTPH
jgi:acyl-CoA synthetase (AMP-forming)/AMP-acid ligase II